MKRPSATVLFITLVILFAALLAPRMLQLERLRDRQDGLEKEIRSLRQENKRLETELEALHKDPLYLERVAREKLNKAREGEIVYKVVRDGEKTS